MRFLHRFAHKNALFKHVFCAPDTLTGMRHSFQTNQWLPFPVGTVFAFFALPMNLPKLMPPVLEARVEEIALRAPSAPQDGAAKNITAAGAETKMVMSLKPFGKMAPRLFWHVRIEEFEWNNYFCDVQEKGPFTQWKHHHYFTAETRDGVEGTLLQDEIEYELRGGMFAELLQSTVKKRTEETFTYRQARTLELLPKFAPLLKF